LQFDGLLYARENGVEMSDRLANKVAIVFGAGSTEIGVSNGGAAAIAFARGGARVVAVDLNADNAQRTVDRIHSEGGRAVNVRADVTCLAQIEAAVDTGIEAFGGLDVLYNNVGINRPGGPVDMEEQVWDAIMATNIKSLFLTSKVVIPEFVKRGSGVIVNVSSITGVAWHGRPTIAYSASKAAVNQFTRSIAAQYGPQNIRCNAILVGSIDTPRASSQLNSSYGENVDEMLRQRRQNVPLRRLGTPWEVANAAVFLASDEASYITGAVVPVDGGLTCSVPHPVQN
jgi:NAD(P)-dependent dehydrogenase (short-subunit alcohol dehydrogenase family)